MVWCQSASCCRRGSDLGWGPATKPSTNATMNYPSAIIAFERWTRELRRSLLKILSRAIRRLDTYLLKTMVADRESTKYFLSGVPFYYYKINDRQRILIRAPEPLLKFQCKQAYGDPRVRCPGTVQINPYQAWGSCNECAKPYSRHQDWN